MAIWSLHEPLFHKCKQLWQTFTRPPKIIFLSFNTNACLLNTLCMIFFHFDWLVLCMEQLWSIGMFSFVPHQRRCFILMANPLLRFISFFLFDVYCTLFINWLFHFHFFYIYFPRETWKSCPKTRCSVIGYCIFSGSLLVLWKLKKQSIVFRSSSQV